MAAGVGVAGTIRDGQWDHVEGKGCLVCAVGLHVTSWREGLPGVWGMGSEEKRGQQALMPLGVIWDSACV